MYQLHDGTPSQEFALVKKVANFESNAATIAPLTKPSHEEKQPIATFRVVDTRCGALCRPLPAVRRLS